MPRGLRRYYHLKHLHFITCSCYRRSSALGEPSDRTVFVRLLGRVRARYRFALLGYVVMPEHFHLLMSEPARGDPSTVMQVLKQLVSRDFLQRLRSAPANSGAAKLLSELEVPELPGRHQFWQRRFYDFNVWSEKKKLEKLEYMHMNPVERGLVAHPAEWPWSSYRFYALGETRMLAMNRWPPSDS